MNFNKNNKRNKEGNNRFGDLKTEPGNPFKKNTRGSNKSRDRDNSTRKSNSGFGSSQKGSYVPPSQRKKKERRSKFKDRAEPEKPKVVIPDVHNKELFPSLGGKPTTKKNIKSQEQVEKAQPSVDPNVESKIEPKIESKIENNNVEKDSEDAANVVTNKKEKKGLWSSVVKYQAPEVTEEDPDYIPPGWVRIKYDKETKEFVYTYAPESEEQLEARARAEAYKRRKAMEEWETMIKNS